MSSNIQKDLSTNIKKQLSRLDRKQTLQRATTRNTSDKKHQQRLALHCTRLQRQLEQLKDKATSYDAVGEHERLEKERQKQIERDNLLPRSKRPRRKGPEFWTLKGAARPAHLVYDFDTRYICPYQKEHDDARIVTQRSVNLLSLYREGKLNEQNIGIVVSTKNGSEKEEVDKDIVVSEECSYELSLIQQYLDLLLEYGHTSAEAKRIKTARAAFLECIDLEQNNPSTTAREALLQLYIDCKTGDAALKIGLEKFGSDTTVAIRYPLAYLAATAATQEQPAMPVKKPNKVDSATPVIVDNQQVDDLIVQAIKSNVLCAWYLAFYQDAFADAMEYVDELLEYNSQVDEPQSSLEEAIEYVNGEQAQELWLSSNGSGAIERLRKTLILAFRGKHATLSAKDVDWKLKLDLLEQDWTKRSQQNQQDMGDDDEAESLVADDQIKDVDCFFDEDDIDKDSNDKGSIVKAGKKRKDCDSSKEELDCTGSEDNSTESDQDDEEDIEGIDLGMYINMFRTSMDIAKDAGKLA